ncbi:universal stress protein [Natronomonas sp. F2-12]|jgi:nucleotide-binding universal stress UspA family protein|uniref:Universal stress protein n=1 Tax=Natronomonas aquatica TaxID=2841590 RepID=A0A9R1CV36_9EURY|nr:universal stress protein [Natronomonas aquatica]MCQ4334146.1 universal stress protein [Natronomonas aquatica]
MYDTVLVATDGSSDAGAALAHAVELAASAGATLQAVSVVETRTAYDNAIIDPEEVRKNLRADAREALERARTVAEDAGVECHTSLEEGPPPDRILAVAEQKGADAVVVGATGRSGFKRLVLGSTAERLLESAPVPVIVIGGKQAAGAD